MMKLGFNEATCMRNSMLAQDVVLAERFGYDFITIGQTFISQRCRNGKYAAVTINNRIGIRANTFDQSLFL
ncbi:hypothetical protein MJN51_37830, partial [Salmonella enterica subsp. enterica serovar Kentucky]|nr:hypothetical protein [Salmonella enterica subsp. enterica serovar Kentucky]